MGELKRAAAILPLLGAVLLFAIALLISHFASTMDRSAGTPDMSVAAMRHACSFMTDNTLYAECLQRVRRAEGIESNTSKKLVKAVPTLP